MQLAVSHFTYVKFPLYLCMFWVNEHDLQSGIEIFGKPRSASEGRLQLDGGFLKNEAIHCYKHKSHCQMEPMKITLPSYCEPIQIFRSKLYFFSRKLK
jgi:hypothetical protein